jgi:D-alanine--D-alanine ligase
MRIVMTYNLRKEEDERQAEWFLPDYVDLLTGSLERLGHEVIGVESSGAPDQVIAKVVDARPDLVFNMAEGSGGPYREALLPTLFEFLNIPYTGGGPELLAISLNKRLTEKLLSLRGIQVPKGCVLMEPDDPIREDMRPPFMVKPNNEGSSIGIHEDSVVDSLEAAKERALGLLGDHPDGVIVEEFIDGREITVPMLSAHPEVLMEPVEYVVKGHPYNIMDYEVKTDEDADVETLCPADLSEEERASVLEFAARVFSVLRTPDCARVDMRMRPDGHLYLIEVNPLPGLREVSPVITSAKAMGMEYDEVIDHILRSACRRQGVCGPSLDSLETMRED